MQTIHRLHLHNYHLNNQYNKHDFHSLKLLKNHASYQAVRVTKLCNFGQYTSFCKNKHLSIKIHERKVQLGANLHVILAK